MELTPRQRAEKAVEHARAGVARARRFCEQAWNTWLSATEARRYALEIEADAEAKLRPLLPPTYNHTREDSPLCPCPACGPPPSPAHPVGHQPGVGCPCGFLWGERAQPPEVAP